MVTLIFEAHSTTEDNEDGIASGWNDVPLSDLGQMQAKELGKRRKDDQFDVIFCSDLQRSYRTAEIAFGRKFIIRQDSRLRECNYGDWNGDEKHVIEKAKLGHIEHPFPRGESWQRAVKRVIEALKDIKSEYDGQRVLIVGHRATQYGIESYVKNISARQAATSPWQYQPGWEYEI